MCMTDPVADMLTRIRNAGMAKHQKVDIPSSNLKVSLATVLRAEGFIKNFKVIADNKQGILRVYLKFIDEKEPVINEIKRISKPGGRVYVNSDKIKQVKNGLGVAILSTSKGLVTDKTAREMGIGGEVLCTVW
ncbi:MULTISPECIES: 30S ribosomal protein S8 [Geobacteraceae]|uniref:Small ribosomal subunit protein uS8 n=3 Tax=Geobacteraceae TaxID=213422 RepID=RS8_CITBB|nr:MULTISPECIES: 30S ribosomal protein S8 [Geobacteraceae]B5EFR4.1 RecName: Full=Small ribosomal subunit protein uS8; AltName: Full=30S ribosomal protein S8 [Citrifermentans bemidjiense Bem]C6E4P3.1 RecName: Full=Small ribosomal subunit protein uS8; AltName: Full=30S ribosomal protein S8 [Geobacter sp. M21]ACH37968.1 ribosomal protein S8 [Citrifermentans bemidjiense Bem]GAW68956.1 30S ribosomal protein S8 [Geoanaerobacter pelophilus]